MLPGRWRGWGCPGALHLKPQTVWESYQFHLQLKPLLEVPRAAWEVPRGPASPSQGSLAISGECVWGSPPDFGRLTHHGEAPVSGARGSRLLWRRQQLQQLELRRASAPPHSLPAARATAAAARPNGPSTAVARAPPRPAPPQPARALPLHCGFLRIPSRQARAARPFHRVRQLCCRTGTRTRVPRRGDYFRSLRSRPLASVPLSSLAEGHRLTESDTSLLVPPRGGNENATPIGPAFPAMRQTGANHRAVCGGQPDLCGSVESRGIKRLRRKQGGYWRCKYVVSMARK